MRVFSTNFSVQKRIRFRQEKELVFKGNSDKTVLNSLQFFYWNFQNNYVKIVIKIIVFITKVFEWKNCQKIFVTKTMKAEVVWFIELSQKIIFWVVTKFRCDIK